MEAKKEDCLKYISNEFLQIYPILECYEEIGFGRPVPLWLEYSYEYEITDSIREKINKSNKRFNEITLLGSLFSENIYWEMTGNLSWFQKGTEPAVRGQEHIVIEDTEKIIKFSNLDEYIGIYNLKLEEKGNNSILLKNILEKLEQIKKNKTDEYNRFMTAISLFYDSIQLRNNRTTSFALQISALESLIEKPTKNCKECKQKIYKDGTSISESFANLFKNFTSKAYAKWLYTKRSKFLHMGEKWEIDDNRLGGGKEGGGVCDFTKMFSMEGISEVEKEYQLLYKEHNYVVDFFILRRVSEIVKYILQEEFNSISL
ncbi:MAG: hypothetical protein WCO66_05025 [Candidatus Absconditabacteria bacterium]